MHDNGFEYGPLARGIFTGLLWLTVLIGFVAPNLLVYYLPLLLFLAFGFKTLLQKTGLYEWYLHFSEVKNERLWKCKTDERRRQVERQERDRR